MQPDLTLISALIQFSSRVISLKRFDLLSLTTGVFAIPLAVVGVHLQSLGSGFLLGYLEKWGFVNQPVSSEVSIAAIYYPPSVPFGMARDPLVSVMGAPEISEAGYLPINDASAMTVLISMAIAFGLVAMASALWAEYRREPTLYPSAGYISGVLAIAQICFLPGFILSILGITAVLIMRHQRDEQLLRVDEESS